MRQPTQHPMVLHGSAQRGIFFRAKAVVVSGIVAQQTAQMALIDDDQVIQAIPV